MSHSIRRTGADNWIRCVGAQEAAATPPLPARSPLHVARPGKSPRFAYAGIRRRLEICPYPTVPPDAFRMRHTFLRMAAPRKKVESAAIHLPGVKVHVPMRQLHRSGGVEQ